MSTNMLLVRFYLKAPDGSLVMRDLDWEKGVKGGRVRLEAGGRAFQGALKAIKTKDINLPADQQEYVSYVPTAGGKVLTASGRHSGVTVWTDLGDGWHARVKVVTPTERREHPEGRECQECRVYDADTGRDMFTKQTHQFVNGGLSQMEWQIHAEAESRGAAPLTESNVGWCWKTKSLVAKNSPACVEHFLVKR